VLSPQKKMLDKVKHYFFDKDADKLRRKDYQGFLGDPDNFSNECRRKHVPEVLRWDNPAVLKETKSQESEQHEIPAHIRERIEAANFHKMLRERDRDLGSYEPVGPVEDE
jgi:hypothetical protein